MFVRDEDERSLKMLKRIISILTVVLFIFTGWQGKSEAASIPVVSKQSAWKGIPIESFTGKLPDGRGWAPLTIESDGSALIGIVPAQNHHPYELMEYNLKRKTRTTIATYSAKSSQVIAVDENAKWIVWSAVEDPYFLNWSLFAYDRVHKKTTRIFVSKRDVNGMGYPGPIITPKLYGNTVVFHTSIGTDSVHGPMLKMKSYDLSKKVLKDLPYQGGFPIITKNFLLWTNFDAHSKTGELFTSSHNKVVQVTKNQNVLEFATDGKDIAWTKRVGDDRNYQWSVMLKQNGKITELKRSKMEDALQFPSIGSRVISWTAYSKAQVYDRVLKKIVTLEDKEDAAYITVFTKGKYLVWTTPLSKDINDARQRGIYIPVIHIIRFK
jgi:hypothetical protein